MQKETWAKDRMKSEPQEMILSQPSIDEEGFITVRKKAMPPATGSKIMPHVADFTQVPTTSVQNSFQALQVLEIAGSSANAFHRRRGVSLMDRICSWNIRGLNWPNKQEDVKIFLHEKRIGFISLLETKVKESKVDLIAHNIFHGWIWHHNFTLCNKGRIWIAWRPQFYKVDVLSQSDQYIHCKASQLSTMKDFYITFVYGANHDQQRRDLWDDLLNIAQSMDDAWCVLGDFNTVLHMGDRIGGTEIQPHEVKSFRECLNNSELQEIRSTGPYFTWTNKTIWTRIDRAFINAFWYNPFAFSKVSYLPNVLSDHTALVMDFPWCPKPHPIFQFCNMWIRDPSFLPLVLSSLSILPQTDPFTKMKRFLEDVIKALHKLNKSEFADLKNQGCGAEKIGGQGQDTLYTYSSKAEWISYGDDCTRYFFSKIKQRKTATYIYSIQDGQGQPRQGFQEVKEVMQVYYKCLLGRQNLDAWNKASVAKLVWCVALKKDKLWVRWVHEKYLKQQSWWDYHHPPDCSWHWKKIVAIKELFKQGVSQSATWTWQGNSGFSIKNGYTWLLGDLTYKEWHRVIWARTVTPRHAFIMWILIHHRVPVKSRLARFIAKISDCACVMCNAAEEDSNHLFFQCTWAKQIWQSIGQWWHMHIDISSTDSFKRSLIKLRRPKREQQITYAIAAVVIYNIWRARNEMIFSHHLILVHTQVKVTKDHRICGPFMWLDHPITWVKKVSVLKLEAKQRKLKPTIPSVTATLCNVHGKESKLTQQLESGIKDETYATLFMMIMLVMYVIMMGIVMC
ncbi:LOW QUALITY PROTEIN: hypothetical protein Cgig2_033194 [Carnegiea gigantea]|uniref:Reverse transcriptase zinc-binding domain-containing protein n=1 Tax=Carnegiea gigantea TaxID=171969 RepID=A0A9Q1JR47_9CARY|nr:LOW QUALITY PROTEIN: hypothetical protein Cgig2_033194 [Carnegiea gigantea]